MRSAPCTVCGKALRYAGVGRRPKTHPGCGKNPGRPRAEARGGLPADPGPQTKRRRDLGSAREGSLAASMVGRARRLAIALRLESDPARAAAFAGVDAKDLPEILPLAMSADYLALREGAQSESAAMIGAGIALGAQRLVERISEIAPASLPSAIKALCIAHDLLGGAKLSYPKIELFWGSPKGEEKRR